MTHDSTNSSQTQQIPSRDFKGIWIPKEIWLDRELSFFEKCLLAEIDSLDGEAGCYASNKYLMGVFDMKERAIQYGLSRLRKLNLIYEEKSDGRNRILRVNRDVIRERYYRSEVQKNAPGGGMQKFAPTGRKSLHPSTKKDTYYLKDKKDKKKDTYVRTPVRPPADADASACPNADASGLSILFFNSIKKTKPDFVGPKNLEKWTEAIDRMIRVDKRKVEEIKAVIEWLPSSQFWRKTVLSAESLRKQFDRLQLAMQEEGQTKWKRTNLAKFNALKKENPDSLRHMTVSGDYLVNSENSKELRLDMNPAVFLDHMLHIAGCRRPDDED